MTDVVTHLDCLFSNETFDLLAKLTNEQTRNSSLDHEEEFKTYVMKPLQELRHQVSSQLPDQITKRMDMQNEMSLYPDPGNKRYEWRFYRKDSDLSINNNNAQLFIGISGSNLWFGFFISENSPDKQRFIQSYQNNLVAKEVILQHTHISNHCILLSSSKKRFERINRLGDWLRHIAMGNSVTKSIQASIHLSKDKVFQYSSEQLSTQIAQTFEGLFPLFLLATCDDPMPALRDYLTFRNQINLLSCYQPSLPTDKTQLELLEHTRLRQEYSLTQCAEDTDFEEAELNRWIRAIKRKKQAILCGSPGTGKTFLAEKLTQHLVGSGDGFWELVQFHPAYAYEDFIQGIRPQSQDGQLKYPLVPGRFLEFCKKAESCQGRCVLIIDEINRANLAQVFGELMYLLEYRDKKIPLAGSSELFGIPENVRIIGTMNTADRSIALVDHALRRRFAFIELRPNYDVLRRYHENKKTGFQVDGLIETLKRLNNAIANKHYEIGISFFLTENLAEELEDIWQMEIEPYLEEYFYDQLEKVDEFRWSKIEQQVRL